MTEAELREFRRFVESHGAERTRWPAADRLRFATLLSASQEARHILAEEEAFERLLAEAPEVSASEAQGVTDALLASLAAHEAPERAGGSSGAGARDGADIVTLPLRGDSPGRPAARRSFAIEGLLLAASLVLGIFTGLQGLVDTDAIPGLSATATSAADSDIDAGEIALGLSQGGFAPEDFL